MNGGEDDDRALDRYLRGDSELSRLYRQAADEAPPPELDARILAHARRDEARPRRAPAGPFAQRWTLPVSLAAVVVLSVTLVLLMQEPDLVPVSEPGSADDTAPAPRGGRSGVGSAAGEGETDRAQPASKAAPALETKSRSSGLREAPEDALSQPPASGKTEPSRQERRAPATPRPSEEIAPMAADAPASAVPAGDEAPEAVRADPRAWLRFVDDLAQRGDEEGALRELAAFRDRYPDHRLPRRLRDLAESAAR